MSNTEICLKVKIFVDDTEVVMHEGKAEFTKGQVESVYNLALQAIINRRKGVNIDAILDRLDAAFVESESLNPPVVKE